MDAARFTLTSAQAERSPAAAVAVVVSGILTFFFAGTSLELVRETLHFNCSWDIGGEWGPTGTWLCADGIGYVGVVVFLGGMSAVLLLIGLGISLARPSSVRSVVYLGLAAVSLAWIGWWTFYAASAYTGPRPVGESGLGLWVETVLPALALSALGLALGALGALTGRRWSPVALWGGVALILVGTIIQPGIGVASVVASGMLVAAGVGRPLVHSVA